MKRTVSWKRIGVLLAIAVAAVIAHPIGNLVMPAPGPEYYDGMGPIMRWTLGVLIEFAALGSVVVLFITICYGIPSVFNYFFPKKEQK